jgi:seryl-tRNA synthetase
VKYPFAKFFEAEGGQAGGTNPEPTSTNPEPTKTENMIPKSRFDEINSKYKEMTEQLTKLQEAEANRQTQAEEQQRKQAEEQGKFQELYEKAQKDIESFKKFEERSTQLETVIKSMVDTKLKDIPAEFHDLLPANLSAEQTLDWLNKAETKGLFKKAEPQDIGKPFNHSNEGPKVDTKNMSALDKILSGLSGK